MKNALRKSALREIRSTLSRFLSIFGIVAIGVGFFSGVKAAAPDMRITHDNNMDECGLLDLRIVSTYGFNDDDIAAVSAMEGAEVYPSYFTDLIVHTEGRPAAAGRLIALTDAVIGGKVNALTLTDGRMPENERECLVDAAMMKGGPAVGSTITFTDNLGGLPDDTISVNEYTVVGRVLSPMYIDKTSRGSTSVGNGSIEAAYYIPEKNFCVKYKTELYVRFPELDRLLCYSSEYRDEAEKRADTAESIGKRRAHERFDEIKTEAGRQIFGGEEGSENYTDDDYRKKFEDFADELDENEKKLDDREKEIEQNEKKLDDAEQQYNDKLKEYEDGLATYEDWLSQYNDTAVKLEQMRDELDSAINRYNDGVKALRGAKSDIEAQEKQLETAKAMIAAALGVESLTDDMMTAYAADNEDIAKLLETQKKISAAKAELESKQRELDDAAEKISAGKKEYSDGEKQFNEGGKLLEDGKQKLDDAKEQLDSAKTEIADGRKELEDGRAKLKKAREQFEEVKKDIEDLKEPEWYVFTRDDDPGYTEYGENADRINNIASVFPVFFIIVAMLVCLTTMSRMIEDQRVGIGTLKALGYENRDIIFKYMFYALSAAFVGCIVGCAVGMKLFPFVIMTAYGMLYDMPRFYLGIDVVTAVSASAVFMAAIALTVWLTARSSLREQAAQLMRPKAPKNGKRILLEHITPIWKHFNFSSKVTARNLFRYKRKMFMTVVGIAGCTALLLTGLALYDAINDVISKQFYDIQDYQGILVYDAKEYPDSPAETAAVVERHGGESIQVYQKMTKVYANGRSVNAYIAVPAQPERFTADFFDLRDRVSGEKFTLSDGDIYLDEKSTLLLGGIGAGTRIEIEKSETDKITVTLTAPFENYPNHYIYMTPATYEELFGKAPEYNVLYFRHDLGTGEGQDRLGEELLTVDGAINVTFNSNTMTTFTTMLESLSLVIMVIIAAAGALAFVVMYNLTNINITERIREIATLKVLGLYDGEVDRYIFRENIILSLIGTGAGLILGIFLARFVITTAEVDIVMFGRSIYPLSFVLAAVITMVFSLLVTLAMHRRLQNVNMIEALKSVE